VDLLECPRENEHPNATEVFDMSWRLILLPIYKISICELCKKEQITPLSWSLINGDSNDQFSQSGFGSFIFLDLLNDEH